MAVRDVVQAAAGVGGGSEYIEDVFSTYLYSGDATTRDIVNGIDLAGEGGLVWIKTRNAANQHFLFDTERGVQKYLSSNNTDAEGTLTNALSAFNSDGFQAKIGINNTGDNQASWTFRKAPKFFDVVTYTGTGTFQTINHNLGSVPGCILVKKTSGPSNWAVYHTSIGNTKTLTLNSSAATTTIAYWGNTDPTTTQFTVGGNQAVGDLGGTYVAYLFASDAGGFGDDGEQSIISCGSYTGNSSSNGPVITLGWEPQWLMVKDTTSVNDWFIWDTMRGLPNRVANSSASLNPNKTDVEFKEYGTGPTPTGFEIQDNNAAINTSGNTYIYIAIRRPMKTPKSGTEVFAPVAYTATSGSETVTSGFPVDIALGLQRNGFAYVNTLFDRFRGTYALNTASSAAESNYGTNYAAALDSNTGIIDKNLTSGQSIIQYMFRRAPGFMDVVAYTGTGVARTLNHNLGVAPELIIVKTRSSVVNWYVYNASIGNNASLVLNQDGGKLGGSASWAMWNTTDPTSSVFSVGPAAWAVNETSQTYIAYLFASLPGVSKVGSYTGTGTTQTINCGFSSGARFVLIKRTDTTGDWYVWDSARGIVAGNDPYLLLNSTAAEVTSTDYIDPVASGFEISSSAPAAINASGGSYIFLAIA